VHNPRIARPLARTPCHHLIVAQEVSLCDQPLAQVVA
jgi:hypothetical protein